MHNTRKLLYSIALAALTVGIAGCTRPDAAGRSNVTIKGSDTMVHLVSHWAEDYMIAHPNRFISVTGGGSGTGVASLLNQTTSLCMSSRDLKEEERQAAADRGIPIEEYAVALDGLAIAVHADNPVEDVTMAQLKGIFTGAIGNWSEVGGADQRIQVLSRESSSGTYVFFQEFVLEKENFTREALLMPATASIIQTLQSNRGAIGYVGLGYAEEAGDSIKLLAVRANEGSPAVHASIETVQSGTYPIARPLFFFTAGEPSPASRQFLDWIQGVEGQQIVVEAGYVPMKPLSALE